MADYSALEELAGVITDYSHMEIDRAVQSISCIPADTWFCECGTILKNYDTLLCARCRSNAKKRDRFLQLAERFNNNIKVVDGCLVWTGAYRNTSPIMMIYGNDVSIRRWLWEDMNGSPPTRNITTTCKTRGCINPNHLRQTEPPALPMTYVKYTLDDIGLKECGRCKIIKPHADFSNLKSTWDGFRGYCKVCKKEHNRKQMAKWLLKDINKFKLAVRGSVVNAFKRRGAIKSNKTLNLLQCDWDTAIKRLGYNRKGYEIDHIIPISWAKTEEEIAVLCQIWNLRRTTKHENRVKRDKAPDISLLHPNLTDGALNIYCRETDTTLDFVRNQIATLNTGDPQ